MNRGHKYIKFLERSLRRFPFILPVPFTLNAHGLKHRTHYTVTSQVRSSADLFIYGRHQHAHTTDRITPPASQNNGSAAALQHRGIMDVATLTTKDRRELRRIVTPMLRNDTEQACLLYDQCAHATGDPTEIDRVVCAFLDVVVSADNAAVFRHILDVVPAPTAVAELALLTSFSSGEDVRALALTHLLGAQHAFFRTTDADGADDDYDEYAHYCIHRLIDINSRRLNVLFWESTPSVVDRMAFVVTNILMCGRTPDVPDGYLDGLYTGDALIACMRRLKTISCCNAYVCAFETYRGEADWRLIGAFYTFAACWDRCGRPYLDCEDMPDEMVRPCTIPQAYVTGYSAQTAWLQHTHEMLKMLRFRGIRRAWITACVTLAVSRGVRADPEVQSVPVTSHTNKRQRTASAVPTVAISAPVSPFGPGTPIGPCGPSRP